MTTSKNTIFTALVGLLVVVVAVQGFIIVKLRQQAEVVKTEPAKKTFHMDLQPKVKAGQGQPPFVPPTWNPPLSTFPSFGGLGPDPGVWDPFKEFRSMRQQMDQLFNDSFGRFRQSPDFQSMWSGTTFSPSMDLEEREDAYVVRMDIPGIDKSNISVNINGRELTVSGRIDETVEEQGKQHLRKERRTGEFKRSATLPGPVEANAMAAKYEDGVLVVTVPKADEEEESRKIEVK